MANPQGNNNAHIPCAYCTFYNERCPINCAYEPYFPFSCLSTFQVADYYYGKKNITKMMRHADAIIEKEVCSTSIIQEAIGWSLDPELGVLGFMRGHLWQMKLLQDYLKIVNDIIHTVCEQPPTSSGP